MYTKSKKREYPLKLAAGIIVLFSLSLLGLAVYYIVYLPVPAPMQPLKARILTILDMEEEEMIETMEVDVGGEGRDEIIE